MGGVKNTGCESTHEFQGKTYRCGARRGHRGPHVVNSGDSSIGLVTWEQEPPRAGSCPAAAVRRLPDGAFRMSPPSKKARAPKLSEVQKDATIEDQRAALEAWRVEARSILDALALASPGNGDSSWYAIGRAQAVVLHALNVGPDDQDRELLDAIERTAEERARLFETR